MASGKSINIWIDANLQEENAEEAAILRMFEENYRFALEKKHFRPL